MPIASRGTGPWGEAIRYWLEKRRLTQAELERLSAIRKNTLSRAKRGYHTTTRVLERIALALEVPFGDILVSPAHHQAAEERKRLAAEITDRVLRDVALSDERAAKTLEHELTAGFDHLRRAAAKDAATRQKKAPSPKAQSRRRKTRR